MVQKTKKTAKTNKADIASLDIDSDAWPRFETLIRNAAKIGPQHRESPKPVKRASGRKRAPSA